MRSTPPALADRPRTLSETLDRVLSEDPGRTAVVGPSGRLSYEALDSRANAAAAALGELGVRPGDRVAACLPNDLDIVAAFHGVMRLGAIWVGVNRNLAAPEKAQLLAASSPSVFVATDEVAADHADNWRALPAAEWNKAVDASAGASRPAAPAPDAPAGIAFTSGTTGSPKGIVHSQRGLLLPAISLVVSRRYDQTLRKGDCLPLTILNMQVLTSLLTSAAGGTCILTDRRDARGIVEWITREQVNVWNGVPAILYSMIHDDTIDRSALAGMSEVWTGGAACPEEIHLSFETRFGVPLRQTYGLTEAPTVVSMEPIDRPHRPEGCGVPLPHLEVTVEDDDGKALDPGQMGEIVVRAKSQGPWAGAYRPMLGFWTGDRVEAFAGDRLHTGDIGIVDETEWVFIRDRKKLLIIRGGANVYPNEVERVIEGIAGVAASAVVGIPDERLGQRVVAAIEVDPGSSVRPEDVIEHCRNQLARYKVPEQVVIVDSFPRNAMGKVQRAALHELFGPA